MLTAGPHVAACRGSRQRALAELLRPSVRHVGLGRVALTVAVGGAPLAAHVVTSGATSGLPLAVVAVAAGAAVGWAVDDPAAELFGACPIGSPRRTQLRVLLAAATAAVAFLLVAATAGVVDHSVVVAFARLPEGVAAGAIALATGLIAWRRGEPAGAASAVSVGFISPFVITALGVRWPAVFPTLAAATPHHRWWLLAAAAAAVALHMGSDPGRGAGFLRLLQRRPSVARIRHDVVPTATLPLSIPDAVSTEEATS